ncbi:MAG: biotin transporter BioY [Holosporales bacterium]|nr:biotin transporter BioY [Holosporales bacterium]
MKCLIGSLIIAIGAQICIPFIPVPLTLQTLGILFVAAALGARYGTIAVLMYFLEGISGIPVFAKFSSGISVILGPTGGYIIGFILAAYLTSRMIEKSKNKTFLSIFYAGFAGSVAVLIIGYLHLAHFIGYSAAYTFGIAPFIPGDLSKLILFALMVSGKRWKKFI